MSSAASSARSLSTRARRRGPRYSQVDNQSLSSDDEDPTRGNSDVEQQAGAVSATAAPATSASVNELPPIAQEISNLTREEASKLQYAHDVESALLASSQQATTSTVQDDHPYINLKTLDDRTLRIPFYPRTQTLHEFRLEVERLTGVSALQQRLIANGRLLENDHALLGLESGAYVHLAPALTQNVSSNQRRRGSGESENDDDDDLASVEFYTSETIVQRQLSQLNALAWVIVVIFTLFAWRLLMNLMFQDDPTEVSTPQSTTIARFFMSVFGIAVGMYGVQTVGSARGLHLLSGQAHQQQSLAVRSRTRNYVLLLVTLALLYLMSTLEAVPLDRSSFIGIMVIQSTFWYCILQARMTHYALVTAASDTSQPTTTSSNATATASTASVTHPQGPIVIAVPTTTSVPGQPSDTEMTVLSISDQTGSSSSVTALQQNRVLTIV